MSALCTALAASWPRPGWASRQHRGGPAAAPAARGAGQGARAGAALKQLIKHECELQLTFTGRVWWGVWRLAEVGVLGSVGLSTRPQGGRVAGAVGTRRETVCTLF